MAFYNLSKEDRANTVAEINEDLLSELKSGKLINTISCFDNDDTYIRKYGYLSIGRIYFRFTQLQPKIIQLLDTLLAHQSFKVRQTVINAAGEIGKKHFAIVEQIFDKGLFDEHHSPRNAVIGSIKKMGEVNPKPVLAWARKYLHHQDKEIRREICHGIELRGRKHPQDILPLLEELQHDKTKRVRTTLIHVVGQIAYKKGCLQTVVKHLKNWDNQQLVQEAFQEIIEVHHQYSKFSAMTQGEAKQYIAHHYTKSKEA